MDVLEHLYEPRKVLQKVCNWLKPRGIFYVFVPNILSWEARIFRSYWYGLDLPRHVHHFTPKSLAHLATSAGLRQVRMVTPAGCYLEESAWLLFDDPASRAGVRRAPLDLTSEPRIAWRVVRKGLRLSVEALFSTVASRCGVAGSIQAVFGKDAGPHSAQDESAGMQGSAKLVKAGTSSATQPRSSRVEAAGTVKSDPDQGESPCARADIRSTCGTQTLDRFREQR